MERRSSAQDLQRVSLALTCRWVSLSLGLSFLATIAIRIADQQFVLAEFATWLPLVNSFSTYGVLALLAVAFSQLAYYFEPEDIAIGNQARIMARLSMGAALGYVLLIPLFVVASSVIARGSVDVPSLLPGCLRLLAMAVGFLGASRTRNDGRESPFLMSKVRSPLDYWLSRLFRW